MKVTFLFNVYTVLNQLIRLIKRRVRVFVRILIRYQLAQYNIDEIHSMA